jgi:hypothetical protein
VDHKFPEIGIEVPGAIRWLKRFQELGAKIILFTMRSDNQVLKDKMVDLESNIQATSGNFLTEAVDYLLYHGIELYGINTNPTQKKWTSSPKAYGHIYIDDAAFGCPLVCQSNGRPYVDWAKVGPAIEVILKRDVKANP